MALKDETYGRRLGCARYVPSYPVIMCSWRSCIRYHLGSPCLSVEDLRMEASSRHVLLKSGVAGRLDSARNAHSPRSQNNREKVSRAGKLDELASTNES